MSNRDEFSSATKTALAQRAGHICSNPDCKAPTAGPSLSQCGSSVNLGVAAHICSAALKGPRSDPSLTPEERRSARNGIWLCVSCSNKIDKNDGIDFSKVQLDNWKQQREDVAAKEIGRPKEVSMSEISGDFNVSGVGDVTGAVLTKPTKIAPGTVFTVSGIGRITGVRN